MKLSKWAIEKGISYQTAYRLFKSGNMPDAYQLPTGTILVEASEMHKDLKIKEQDKYIEFLMDVNKSLTETIKKLSVKPVKKMSELERLRQLKKRLIEKQQRSSS